MHDVFTLRNTKESRRKKRNHPQWSHACFTARDNNIEFCNNERRRKKGSPTSKGKMVFLSTLTVHGK